MILSKAKKSGSCFIKKRHQKRGRSLQRFWSYSGEILWKDVADAEVYYALKQTDVILSGDAKQHELFDFEKYGTIGAIRQFIEKGKNSDRK